MADTLKQKAVITRKAHQCFSCLRTFPPDTRMRYWVGVFEGEFTAVYACATCIEIMNLSRDSEFPEGYVSDMLDTGQTPEQLLKKLKENSVIRRVLLE